MAIQSLLTRPTEKAGEIKKAAVKITVFHCYNALGDVSSLARGADVAAIRVPCSGMNREVVLLKAFEAGADAVVVLACPEGSCRYLQGNIHAKKRVERVKKILDEIGLDGRRLNFYNVSQGDRQAVENILARTLADISTLGQNPAAR